MSVLPLLGVAAILVGLVFVYPVIVLHSTQRSPSAPHLVAISVERVGQPLGALLKRVVDPLLAAGFTLQGYVEGPAAPTAKVGIRYLVPLISPDRLTWAIARGVQRTDVRGEPLYEAHAEFTTLFPDDAEVDTNSSTMLGFFVRREGRAVYSFPDEHDPRVLYDLHQRLVERHRHRWQTGPRNPPATLEEGLQRIRRLWPHEYEQQVAAGVFTRVDDGTYRLTWKGAIRGVALLGTPGKQIRTELLRRRAAALAAELRAQPEGS